MISWYYAAHSVDVAKTGTKQEDVFDPMAHLIKELRPEDRLQLVGIGDQGLDTKSK